MKKQNKKIIIIAILIVLVVAIAITLKIVFENTDEEKQQQPSDRESSTGNFVSEIDINDTTNSEIREDGMKINNSSIIAKGLEFNSVFVKDITIESTGDMAVFNATVENNLGKDLEEYIIFLVFYRKDGSIIDRVETLFPNIPDGETGYITATTPKDIATAYRMEIERLME